MNKPMTLNTRQVAEDTWQLGGYLPIPGYGLLAINSFYVSAKQPLLVDTGIAPLGPDYIDQLQSICALQDLRWILLTHMDVDHIGNLAAVLQRAPRARVITNFLGAGKLGLMGFETAEIEIVEPGDSLDLGDRELQILQLPSYDAPETIGGYDSRNRTLFSSDCFGALVPREQRRADDLPREELMRAISAWSLIDTPWLADTDRDALFRRHADFFALRPELVLSGHLAPLHHDHREIFENLLGSFELAA